MKKIIPYITLIPLVLLALTPPWVMKLDCTLNSLGWLWAVFLSGFLAFLFLNFKVNIFLKLLLIWCYIGCFISKAPYLCFTLYWSVIGCAYYYLLCTKVTDFEPAKKTIQALFFFVTLLIIMQKFGLDTLLNFNQKDALILGTIGNYMILGSYICILAPFLISVSWLNWIPLLLIGYISGSSGTMLSLCAGLGVYLFIKVKRLRIAIVMLCILIPCLMAYKTGDFTVFTRAGRLPVWKRTIELTNKQPQGYGIATYRILFPLMSQDLESSHGADEQPWEYENTKGRGLAWRRAHNCWTQILFETGYPGFILFIGFIGSIAWYVRKDALKFAGLIIIGMNMTIHFPTRMTQSILVMLMYLAYCKYKGVENDNRQVIGI